VPRSAPAPALAPPPPPPVSVQFGRLRRVRLFRRSSVASPGGALSDGDLRSLLIADPDRGWRAFIDQHTPRMLALIERGGIRDQDEAMEVYTLVCERLAEDDCARIRRFDPGKGTIAAWLSVLVRNTMVDWVRARAGRRRLFKSIQALPPLEQKVFELFYWENRMPAEIVGALEGQFGSPSLAIVFEAFERVQAALTERQRAELVAMTARATAPASLDAPTDDEDQTIDAPDPDADLEAAAQVREIDALMERALAALPPRDALIVRLKFVEGLTLKQIRAAADAPSLTDADVHAILERLKGQLAVSGVASGDVAAPGLAFLDGGES
jgi:RNA polymerase sigma factor (sigma-70 family)